MTVSPSGVLARLDDELRALWVSPGMPQATGAALWSHACTMNLVVVAPTPELGTLLVPVVDRVVRSVPARAIVVGLDPDSADDLQASVSAVCSDDASTAVCSERVTLVARGALCNRLPSCIDALCATDVPMTLVWLPRVHADDPVFGPLARRASRIIVDAAQSSMGSLSHVVRWARGLPVAERPGIGDLAWTRLAPWQELCSRMFDPPPLRDLAQRITRVSLAHAGSSRAIGPEAALFLGWMASRLGWKTASLAGKLRVVRADGRTVQALLRPRPESDRAPGTLLGVEIDAGQNDSSLHGEIAGDADGDAATWLVRVSGGGETQQLEQHARLRAVDAALVIERTLHRSFRDDALAEAALWADELRGEELASG